MTFEDRQLSIIILFHLLLLLISALIELLLLECIKEQQPAFGGDRGDQTVPCH